MTAGVGDHQPVIGQIGDAARDRVVGGTIGETDDSRGVCEQAEQPDHRQHRQQAEDVGLGLRTADGHQGDRRGDDSAGDQQHQNDAAAPPRRLVGGDRLSRRIVVSIGGHRKRTQPVDVNVTR